MPRHQHSPLYPPSPSTPASLVDTASEDLTNASTPSTLTFKYGTSDDRQRGRPSSMSTTTTMTDDAPPSSGPSIATLLCFSALTISIFLVALDTVLIPTALPSISHDFHIPDSLYAWTGSAYLLANAASIPFWGKLSDVFGRRPIILIANSIFLAGSIVCAVSVNATMLVAGRAVQGLGGGGVNVLVYVCVADLFTIRSVIAAASHPRRTSLHHPAIDRSTWALLEQCTQLPPHWARCLGVCLRSI